MRTFFAEAFHWAAVTLRVSCGADVTAEVDNAVAKVGLNLFLNAFVEDLFYF